MAAGVGALGYVGRASGLDVDARRDHPYLELGAPFSVVLEHSGDVLGRFPVLRREMAVSAALVLDLAVRLGGSTGTGHVGAEGGWGAGLGLVEGWRGTIAHRVELDSHGFLSRVKVVDPSFFNWPAPRLSLADTIVAGFPLANKSFNLSYAGNDCERHDLLRHAARAPLTGEKIGDWPLKSRANLP